MNEDQNHSPVCANFSGAGILAPGPSAGLKLSVFSASFSDRCSAARSRESIVVEFGKALLCRGELIGPPLSVGVGERVADMLGKGEEEGMIDVEPGVRSPYTREIPQVVRA